MLLGRDSTPTPRPRRLPSRVGEAVAFCRTQALWTGWNDLRVSSTARLSDPGAEHAGADRWWRFAVLAAVLYLAAFTAIPPDSVEIRTVMNAAADLAAVLMILYGVR